MGVIAPKKITKRLLGLSDDKEREDRRS